MYFEFLGGELMAKYSEGLGYEIIKAVNNGEIIEPITSKKVKEFCEKNGLNPTKSHLFVILSNSTENTHSPTYAKYFERIAKGKYILHPDYRKHIKYYWLNVDSDLYEWTFTSMNIGDKETYSNLNEEGGKRRNQSCFQNIKIGDRVIAYETGYTRAITAICQVISKVEEKDKIIVEFEKQMNFDKLLTLYEMKVIKSLANFNILNNHRGTLLEIEKKYFDEIVKILENTNAQTDHYEILENEVQKSRKLSSKERKKLLQDSKNTIPEKIERKIFDFIRNPNVVAEVLERASGVCEECSNPAPFIKASDGTPYLEVHHKIRLADGGDDTVDNAIAVCPNCHRKLHYG
jgi:hypothetical protein